MSEKCSAGGQDLPAPTEHRRKPQDKKKWPPNMSADEIEEAINKVCGCAGRHNCDCASVFNGACGDAWFHYNTSRATA